MKIKKINYYYILIAFIAIILIAGYTFELGESLGKSIAK